jgi:hypothetical protein
LSIGAPFYSKDGGGREEPKSSKPPLERHKFAAILEAEARAHLLTIDPRHLTCALGGWLTLIGGALAADRVPVTPAEGVSVEILKAVRQAGLVEVTLDVEIVGDQRAQLVGFRSMRTVADIDCKISADQVRETQMFEQPGLKGSGLARPPRSGWVRPTEGAYMMSVIRQACAPPAPPTGPPAKERLPARASAIASNPAPRRREAEDPRVHGSRVYWPTAGDR